jgi:hypothetical protein
VLPAIEGFGLGFVGGAAFGAVATYALCSVPRDGCFDESAKGMSIVGAALFAVVGRFVCLFWGWSSGRTTTYWYGSFAP